MADPFGFLKYERVDNPYREINERIKDFNYLEEPLKFDQRAEQAARCMNCGVPYCHIGALYGDKSKQISGCPNDNLIPEWNDLLYRKELHQAWLRLAKTNPIPEFTGKVCPAPCEVSCNEFLNGEGVTIKDNEDFIVEYAFAHDWVVSEGLPAQRTGKKIAVIGSGPAGITAAWRLNQLGHEVTIFEKDERFGGLLMFGIPNMKLEKWVVDRRFKVMSEVGIKLKANTTVGKDITKEQLDSDFDKVIIATGASIARDINVPGRNLQGIDFALPFLNAATENVLKNGTTKFESSLSNKKVIVIGSGDTATDCIATAVRLGAENVTQFDYHAQKPTDRTTPWPEYPWQKQITYGQAEAIETVNPELIPYQTQTVEFLGNEFGEVIGVRTVLIDSNKKVIPNSEKEYEADLILIAVGFTGLDTKILNDLDITQLNVMGMTNQENYMVAGDANTGANLVITAIHDARLVAEMIDSKLQSFADSFSFKVN
ncbi:glutamate synthase subunit beta [Leuconostoc suionicum]|uniref:glutamate synthase subunit beta n=1 Tax=Leuconostoc suionicum TaxID=1511761 RepID=UPI00233F5750|nr:glutamate synthase subunit beta [Leuconostoc suionicum]MDC2815598.1 glutamate synthase subunit beta [Leuconostoc suionicum]